MTGITVNVVSVKVTTSLKLGNFRRYGNIKYSYNCIYSSRLEAGNDLLSPAAKSKSSVLQVTL